MLKVKVKFFGELADLVGCKEREFILSEGETVEKLLNEVEKLSDKHGSELGEQKLSYRFPHIEVIVNGESIGAKGGPATQLCSGDIVHLLPVISGG